MQPMTKEEKKKMKNLMNLMETKKLLVLEIRGDFSDEQIEDFLCECISDCVQKGLINLSEISDNDNYEEAERFEDEEDDDEDIITLEHLDVRPL